MDTRKFLLIYRLNHNSSAQIEYFVDEDLARKLANRLYTQGFYDIELFKTSWLPRRSMMPTLTRWPTLL